MAGKRGYHTQQLKEALLQIELEIQAGNFDMITKEIYENVGQVLSLAHLQLTYESSQSNSEKQQAVHQTGQLIAKAIRDLRQLCSPVTIAEITDKGLCHVLEHEVAFINNIEHLTIGLHIKEPFKGFGAVQDLILFSMLRQSLHYLTNLANNTNIDITIEHTADKWFAIINCAAFKMDELTYTQWWQSIAAKASLINAGVSMEQVNSDNCVIEVSWTDSNNLNYERND